VKLDHHELIKSKVKILGALDFDQRPEGVSPRRLPDWTRLQVPLMLETMLRMPSGVRLAFRTDSKSVELTLLISKLVAKGTSAPVVGLNLEVEGEPLRFVPTRKGNTVIYSITDPDDVSIERGEADVVRFDDLPSGVKNVQVWLPHNAYVELREFKLDPGSILESSNDPSRHWVHYGSSISHCMEAEQPALTWPAVAARAGGVSLHSLGFGGQCHLDQFIARTIRDLKPDVISIKVGINIINMDSMRERVFVPALHGFLDTIREGNPETKILLVSPIFCPSAENSPGPTLPDKAGKFVTFEGNEKIRVGCMSLSRIRTLIEEVVRTRSDENLAYLDGLNLFSSEDAGDLPDDLHPNPAGYIRMGERFADHAFEGFLQNH
jgi:lysophospholipase L1-like esterase